jgi:chorismate dehydratase
VTNRIGGVPYGVGAPLLAGLSQEPSVQFVQAPPTELIAELRAGRLDAALVSSIEAVRMPGYHVLADLGIAAKYEVRSVRAFRRRGKRIDSVGLDRSSATSAALLRLLLQGPRRDDVGRSPSLHDIAPTRMPDALPHDLVLLIGDDGLHAAAGDREVWDLAQEWRRWTGLPFVFAVWVLRPGAARDRIAPLLHTARARGRRLGRVDGTHGAVHYDLDEEDRLGLRRFWHEARMAGLAPAGSEPQLHAAAAEGASP